MVKEITDTTFNEVLEQEKAIVDFWAEWCGPCKILGPRFEELSQEMTDIKFYKLDVDANQQTSSQFGVRSIPTLLLFKKGEKIGEIIGAYPKDMMKEKITETFK